MVSYRRGYVIEIDDMAKRGQKILELLEKHGRLILAKEGQGIRVDVPRGAPQQVPAAPASVAHVIASRMLGATN